MKFAQVDVFDGAGYYEDWFVFVETSPVNSNFEEMSMGDRNFVNNSGSYFIMGFFITVYYLVLTILNYFGKLMA